MISIHLHVTRTLATSKSIFLPGLRGHNRFNLVLSKDFLRSLVQWDQRFDQEILVLFLQRKSKSCHVKGPEWNCTCVVHYKPCTANHPRIQPFVQCGNHQSWVTPLLNWFSVRKCPQTFSETAQLFNPRWMIRIITVGCSWQQWVRAAVDDAAEDFQQLTNSIVSLRLIDDLTKTRFIMVDEC